MQIWGGPAATAQSSLTSSCASVSPGCEQTLCGWSTENHQDFGAFWGFWWIPTEFKRDMIAEKNLGCSQARVWGIPEALGGFQEDSRGE